MSTQAGLSLLWMYLSFYRFCCALAHLQLRCTTLKAPFVVHKFLQGWITHKARKIILILNQIAVLTHPNILYGKKIMARMRFLSRADDA